MPILSAARCSWRRGRRPLLDFGRDDEARLELERAAALLPDERPATRRRRCSPHWPSQRAIAGDFAGARSAAEQAVAAATGVGAAGREAARA